jgi:CrcB protein
MGGLTTYSTFSYETVRLIEARAWHYAVANVVVTTAACLALCVLGMAAGRYVLGARG